MEKYLNTDLDYGLWVLLAHARHAMVRVRQNELQPYKISSRQAAVLTILHEVGNEATPARVARWIFREPHSISWLISNMEEEGLVKKVRDLDKKNQVRVKLTEKGYEAYYASVKREAMHKVMSCLSEDEKQQLKPCLQKLLHKALEMLGAECKALFLP